MTLRVTQENKNILASVTTISFSETTMSRGVHINWNAISMDRLIRSYKQLQREYGTVKYPGPWACSARTVTLPDEEDTDGWPRGTDGMIDRGNPLN